MNTSELIPSQVVTRTAVADAVLGALRGDFCRPSIGVDNDAGLQAIAEEITEALNFTWAGGPGAMEAVRELHVPVVYGPDITDETWIECKSCRAEEWPCDTARLGCGR